MHNPTTRPLRTNRSLLVALAAGFLAAAVGTAWGQIIGEDLKLLPSDGAAEDGFGYSIAIANGVVAVGAWGDDDNGDRSGSAYLFDASTGTQMAKLLPSDGEVLDVFGCSIAVDNGLVAVGAFNHIDNASGFASAYLFDASTGTQITKLVRTDAPGRTQFGGSIAINNGVVAVGAWGDDDNGNDSGAAYVFDAATGEQRFRLLPDDGAAYAHFGISIAIDSGIVAVGASGDEDNGIGSGSAYLFDASTGTQIAKLLPSDGAAGDEFGISIAIDDGIVAVGAMRDDDNGVNSGSVYLFDAFTGTQTAKLLPSDGAANDFFGFSVAIDDGVVAVGAERDDNDNGTNTGAAYVFDVSTGEQIAKLLPSDGQSGDYLGHSIAINNGVVAVGSYFDNDNGVQSGSAYVFTTGTQCPADLNGDGEVNTQDFIAFLNAWANGDPVADWDGNGTINTLDFLAYLNDWSAGCP